MISAKEAKAQAMDAVQTEMNLEMERIAKRIEDACANGLFRCFVPEACSKQIISKLRDAGYRVEIYNQYNETETMISWEGDGVD